MARFALKLCLLLFCCLSPTTLAAKPIIDAAVYTNDRTYFFSTIGYYRLKNGIVEKGYPKLMRNWKGLPDAFLAGIDAALFNPKNKKLYFFKGSQYVRISGTKVEGGYPAPIAKWWKGLPKRFHSNLDAAIYRKGHAYLFKGNEYARLTNAKMDKGYPKKLPGGWGLPKGFRNGLDAALNSQQYKKNYFFKDKKYVRLTDTKLDKGYPKSLKGWKGILDKKRYEPSINTVNIEADFITGLLNTSFDGTKLRLDNYDGDHHQSNYSRLTLPKQLFDGKEGKDYVFTIPEVNKGAFYYYINDIDSTGVRFATKKDRITMRIDFESGGTEIPGRCFHNAVVCIVGNDKAAPDVQWNNLSVELQLKPKAKDGKVYLTDPKIVIGGTPNVGGICSALPVDLCDFITGYRQKLKQALSETLVSAVNSKGIQERLATTIRDRILNSFSLELIADIKLKNGDFVITHGFPETSTLFGEKP